MTETLVRFKCINEVAQMSGLTRLVMFISSNLQRFVHSRQAVVMTSSWRVVDSSPMSKKMESSLKLGQDPTFGLVSDGQSSRERWRRDWEAIFGLRVNVLDSLREVRRGDPATKSSRA